MAIAWQSGVKEACEGRQVMCAKGVHQCDSGDSLAGRRRSHGAFSLVKQSPSALETSRPSEHCVLGLWGPHEVQCH